MWSNDKILNENTLLLEQLQNSVRTVAQSNKKIVDVLWVESTLIHFVKINY